jgi:hypothetical protein
VRLALKVLVVDVDGMDDLRWTTEAGFANACPSGSPPLAQGDPSKLMGVVPLEHLNGFVPPRMINYTL